MQSWPHRAWCDHLACIARCVCVDQPSSLFPSPPRPPPPHTHACGAVLQLECSLVQLSAPVWHHQGSFRVGIDEYVKQREAKVMERLEGGGELPSDLAPSPELSPARGVG